MKYKKIEYNTSKLNIYYIFFNILNQRKFGQFVIINIIKLIPQDFKIIIKNQLINNLNNYSKVRLVMKI